MWVIKITCFGRIRFLNLMNEFFPLCIRSLFLNKSKQLGWRRCHKISVNLWSLLRMKILTLTWFLCHLQAISENSWWGLCKKNWSKGTLIAEDSWRISIYVSFRLLFSLVASSYQSCSCSLLCQFIKPIFVTYTRILYYFCGD